MKILFRRVGNSEIINFYEWKTPHFNSLRKKIRTQYYTKTKKRDGVRVYPVVSKQLLIGARAV